MRSAILEHSCDVIITDHELPRFNSSEVLSVVRENKIDTPVIIVSGIIGEDRAVEAMRNGANDYIMKTNLSRLVPAIEREMREAESRIARRQAEDMIVYMAYHDYLTGLANRFAFEEKLTAILEKTKSGHDSQNTLMYLDLDQFKVLNDTAGHTAGDELLRRISSVITRIVSRDIMVARLGGDEFAVILENFSAEKSRTIGYQILKSINELRF
ncbi:MAG: GGDEF domain-containing response regulator, partial [Leptospira sp.]|nr:GGDEF domain-containing response regulator [Leptospira sp.]